MNPMLTAGLPLGVSAGVRGAEESGFVAPLLDAAAGPGKWLRRQLLGTERTADFLYDSLGLGREVGTGDQQGSFLGGFKESTAPMAGRDNLLLNALGFVGDAVLDPLTLAPWAGGLAAAGGRSALANAGRTAEAAMAGAAAEAAGTSAAKRLALMDDVGGRAASEFGNKADLFRRINAAPEAQEQYLMGLRGGTSPVSSVVAPPGLRTERVNWMPSSADIPSMPAPGTEYGAGGRLPPLYRDARALANQNAVMGQPVPVQDIRANMLASNQIANRALQRQTYDALPQQGQQFWDTARTLAGGGDIPTPDTFLRDALTRPQREQLMAMADELGGLPSLAPSSVNRPLSQLMPAMNADRMLAEEMLAESLPGIQQGAAPPWTSPLARILYGRKQPLGVSDLSLQSPLPLESFVGG